MKKIGILYICTASYTIFWKSFFKSCEKYFLVNDDYEKHYFVFTDNLNLKYKNKKNVTFIYQKHLEWPYSTLFRFKFFNKQYEILKKMDYIFFFNANMLFIDFVDEEVLPQNKKRFSFLLHPGFFDKEVKEFTYETKKNSLAFVDKGFGQHYFAGGLNAGFAEDYLEMSKILEKNIDIDLKNGIIAIWHDESHLNNFAVKNKEKIKILDPSYGYPQNWNLPFKPKILILDKNKFGGHDFLRKKHLTFFKKICDKLFS